MTSLDNSIIGKHLALKLRQLEMNYNENERLMNDASPDWIWRRECIAKCRFKAKIYYHYTYFYIFIRLKYKVRIYILSLVLTGQFCMEIHRPVKST